MRYINKGRKERREKSEQERKWRMERVRGCIWGEVCACERDYYLKKRVSMAKLHPLHTYTANIIDRYETHSNTK